MTRSHRATLDKTVEPTCECGASCQDIPHLLFFCPLVPPPSPLVLSLCSAPPALASALLLSPSQRGWKDAWKEACIRIKKEDLRPQATIRDMKDHVPALESTHQYFYCCRCHVARRARDYKWLFMKPCGRAEEPIVCEGDYIFRSGHLVRLQMRTWRTSSIRPAFSCLKCPIWWWASELPPMLCSGGDVLSSGSV